MSEINSELLTFWRWLTDRATPGPWSWWTSNSWRRLSSDPSGKDGDVLYPFVNQADKHPDCAVSEENQEFIAVARTAMPALLDEVIRLRRLIQATKHYEQCRERVTALESQQRLCDINERVIEISSGKRIGYKEAFALFCAAGDELREAKDAVEKEPLLNPLTYEFEKRDDNK